MFMEKSGSTNSILLTISLEIRMCTVLKALREVVSLHLGSSFSALKCFLCLKEAGSILLQSCLFLVCVDLLICTGDGGGRV